MTGIWLAADAFSDLWIESPHTASFRRALEPTPHDPQQSPLQAGSVHELLVTYSMLRSQPLLLGKRLGRVPDFQQLYAQPDVASWFEVAQRFAFSLVDVVEFLRSRLPRYPMLLAPDLLAGASRVHADGFWDQRFPWEQEVRMAKLHFASEPKVLAQALELPHGGREAYAALAALARALHESETWRRFVAAHESLSPEDRDLAKTNLREYRKLVAEDRLDAIAGDTGMRSANMRRAGAESNQVPRQGHST